MMSSRLMRVSLALLLVSGLAIVTSGCDKAADKAGEAIVEGATGVDVDADENKVTIEGEDGESIEIQAGENELPDGFPDDAPVYDADIESSGSISVDNQTSYTVAQVTKDDFDDVVAWYKSELEQSGWTEAGMTESEIDGARFALFSITRDGAEGTISVQQESDGSEVMIGFTVLVNE